MTGVKRGFSTAEAADYIGRSESHIRRLKRDKKLAARRDGAVVTYLLEDLDAYLDSLAEDD